MNRLAGISLEKWGDEKLWTHVSAHLGGRPFFTVNTAGLAAVVGRNPVASKAQKRLPTTIALTREELTDTPYEITLGHDRGGQVYLDIARENRSILIGGTSGAGKTNVIQAILLQLALKHTPDEVQFAIVDTKEVDFSGAWRGLPHLFKQPAYTVEAGRELIERVEAERLRRKGAMVRAGVSDWQDLPDPPPLLLLVVDEAADFEGEPAVDTLTKAARKGRAMGISLVFATQHPTSDVIPSQIKANLSTAIGLKCRTQTESRVILDRGGADKLTRPGLALTYLENEWRSVQVLWAPDRLIKEVSNGPVNKPDVDVLEEIEAEMVAYAIEELDGAFTINRLYEEFRGKISRRQINRLAQTWEARGWLTEPGRDSNGHPIGRRVTPELEALIS